MLQPTDNISCALFAVCIQCISYVACPFDLDWNWNTVMALFAVCCAMFCGAQSPNHTHILLFLLFLMFSFLFFFCYLSFMPFLFAHSLHSSHSHAQHNNFLASNNISRYTHKKNRIWHTDSQIRFDSNCMFSFFALFYFCSSTHSTFSFIRFLLFKQNKKYGMKRYNCEQRTILGLCN